MPKPVCIQCGGNDSLLWRKQENGQICNECYLANTVSKEQGEAGGEQEEAAGPSGRGARKSTRAARSKTRARAPAQPAPRAAGQPGPRGAGQPAPAPRGRGRRSLFKRPPVKAPAATATVVSSDSVFHKGKYMQVGDVVSMLDVDGGTYYAQIRGFLTDQYCEKSAVVTWLLPTKASPPPEQCFDPATYIIGPEEELARKLDYMEFVMHAPSDYYKSTITPFPPTERDLNNYSGYIWTSMEPKEKT